MIRRARRRAIAPRPDLLPRPDVPPRPDPGDGALRRSRRIGGVAIVVTAILASTVGVVTWAARVEPAHAFLASHPDGGPVRWDPCTPIRYQVNLDGAPPGAAEAVRIAVERVGEATGIEFIDDGTTDRTAEETIGWDFRGPPPATDVLPVLIAWVPAKEFKAWASPRLYVAFGLPERTGVGGAERYESGVIVVNGDGGAIPGDAGPSSLEQVLMHEWAHVLGLGHVRSGDELMWSSDLPGADAVPNLEQTDWGPGDREGLAAVGRSAGCLAPV